MAHLILFPTLPILMSRAWVAFALLLLAVSSASALDNGLARTPPMGWSSWNTFACDINEDLIKQTADALVSSGLAAAGYKYLNLDDCWMAGRDASGHIYANTTKFPSGMKALGDYIHAKGLKFGIYTSSGQITCMGYTGSNGYEKNDALTFASWGADYLKLDCCNQSSIEEAHKTYEAMSDALLQSGRPIVFSCDTDELMLRSGNKEAPWTWAPARCNLARIWLDIKDNWRNLMDMLDHAANVQYASQPGYWNDLDILTVGMGGQTLSEYRAHFSLWSILSSPLLLGNDVRNMSQDALAILTAPEVVQVNQDPLGIAGERIRTSPDGTLQLYGRPLQGPDGTVALVLFNRGDQPQNMTVDFYTDIYGNNLCCPAPNPPAKVLMRDLWKRQDLGVAVNNTTFLVNAHDVVMLKLTPTN